MSPIYFVLDILEMGVSHELFVWAVSILNPPDLSLLNS
jgi:hypothetical protein